MAALIDENTQFVGTDGRPIVAGSLYIGVQGQDPVLNPITIYSDRALTTSLANPQILDANGKSTNKIWVPGKYSMRVNDVNAVQKLIDLDLGLDPATGITTLSSVIGINAITAIASPAITAYEDRELYVFVAASANTGAVTLDAGGGALAIKRNHTDALIAGDIKEDQVIVVAYGADDNVFDLVSPPSAAPGPVRQVVTATSAVNDLTSSIAYVNTSLTATITPRYADSKILIQVNAPYDVRGDGTNTGQRYGEAQIYRSSGTPASLHEVRIGRAVENSTITSAMQMYLPASFQAEEEPGAGTHVYIVRHKVVATNVDMTLAGASTEPSTHNSGPASITLWEVEP